MVSSPRPQDSTSIKPDHKTAIKWCSIGAHRKMDECYSVQRQNQEVHPVEVTQLETVHVHEHHHDG